MLVKETVASGMRNPNTDADDWLFTKLLHFTQAKTYEISFWYGTTDEFQPQNYTSNGLLNKNFNLNMNVVFI